MNQPKKPDMTFSILNGSVLAELEVWAGIYEFSFQFWGEDNNNVFISRNGVEITSFGGFENIKDALIATREWIYKTNPSAVPEINPNF